MQRKYSWVSHYAPMIPALGRHRQDDQALLVCLSEAMLGYMRACLKKQQNSILKQEQQQNARVSVYHTYQVPLDVTYCPAPRTGLLRGRVARQDHLKHQDIKHHPNGCGLHFLLPKEVSKVFQALGQDFLTYYVGFIFAGVQSNSHRKISSVFKSLKALRVKEASNTLTGVGSRGRKKHQS